MKTDTKDIEKQRLLEDGIKGFSFEEEFNVLKNMKYPEKIDIADKTMSEVYKQNGRKRKRFINSVVATSLLAACFIGVIFMTTRWAEANNDRIINEFLEQVYFQDYFQQISFEEEFFTDIDFE